MSQIALEALKPVGPVMGKIRAIAVTSTTANTDLSAISEFTGKAARIFRLQADGADIYYGWYNVAGQTLDDTNTTQANATQAALIPAGQFRDECIPYIYAGPSGVSLYSFLHYKTASGTGKLRITVVSEDPGDRGAT